MRDPRGSGRWDLPAQVMQRHLEFFLVLHGDAQGGVFQMRVGVGRHDVECILNCMHFCITL